MKLDRCTVATFVTAIVLHHSSAVAQTNDVQVSKQLTATEIGTAAVLAFEGAKGHVFSDLVVHELLQRGVRLVERAKLAAVLRERELTLDDLAAGRVDPRTVHEVARVDALVFGSVTPITVYLSGADSGRFPSPRFGSLMSGLGAFCHRCPSIATQRCCGRARHMAPPQQRWSPSWFASRHRAHPKRRTEVTSSIGES